MSSGIAHSISRTARDTPLPVSFGQQRLWFFAQLAGDSDAYHICFRRTLRGHLNGVALRRALDRIVMRHEALRTTFVQVDGAPMQQIRPVESGAFLLREHDLRSHADPDGEHECLMLEETRMPFDLEAGPLVRGRLIRRAEDEHTLLLTLHHIVADGWSMRVFLRELRVLYEAFRLSQADPLPPLAVQYADYAVWQREWIESDLLREQAAYWRAALAGAPALLTLPTDRDRPVEQDHSGGTVSVVVDAQLTAGLKQLSRRHRTTLFQTVMAGWAALLGRLAGQSEVVVGTPVANRHLVEVEPLIGFFVNTLAIRIDLSGEPTVADLLKRVKTQTLGAQRHQNLPFEHVVEIVRPVRSLAHSPVFQTMLAWQYASDSRAALADLDLKPLAEAGPYVGAKFDLTLWLQEEGNTIEGGIKYSTALFDKKTVERYLGYFRTLLTAMAADDHAIVDRVNLLAEGEQQRVISGWNQTASPFPYDTCLHELIEAQVMRTPAAPAVVDDNQTLSYGELNTRANQLARYLREYGVGPDARVAICLDRRVEMVVALLAVLKAGGAYVPLDTTYPPARLRFMLEDSAPVALLTDDHIDVRLPDRPPGFSVLNVTAAQPPWRNVDTANLDRAHLGLTADHLAYIIYTSGSTGAPKGVMVVHRGLVNYLGWAAATYCVSSAVVSSSLAFDATVTSLYEPLLLGGTVRLLREGGEIDGLVDELQTLRSPLVKLTPGHLEALGSLVSLKGATPSVGVFVVGGEALSASTVRMWQRLLPGVRVVNEYGPTETVVGCVVHEVPQTDEGMQSIPIGRPIANVHVFILDRQGAPVPVGVAGELHIGGVGVARGYLGRPALTAERFLPNPFSNVPGARMYRTGDLGRWRANGAIEFLGRTDFQIKVRGFRIEPGEIEVCLVAQPDVQEAVVIAREGTAGEARLVAYYTTAGGSDVPNADTLGHALRQRLPAFMVPAAYVHLVTWPMTPNGKLDRRALPAPGASAYATSGYEAPCGEVETSIAEIWAEVLRIERVGRYDDFFALGGHSLLAVRVISRLRQRRFADVTVRDVFLRPVLADLAAHLAASMGDELPRIVPVERRGLLPVSFGQQRLWFLAQLEQESDAYHVSLCRTLRGRLDVTVLRQALDRIVTRHETLRTTFVQVDGVPMQQVHSSDASAFLLREHDLRAHPDPDGERDRLTTEESRTPFDLETGPLVRGLLIRHTEHTHTLLLTLHHIVTDGWSMGVFLHELSVLYNAFERDEPDPLPPLSVQYADYALWQRQRIASDRLSEQTDYWTQTLADAPAVLTLPADRARPTQHDHAGAIIPFELDRTLTSGLSRLGRRHESTLYQTVLAGWAALLARLASQPSIVIGTPVANRDHVELEPLIGFFVNTLAIHVDVSGAPTVGDLVRRVKKQALAAQQHQDLPFERVVEITRPARSLAHSPLFQVMLAWQHKSESESALTGLEVLPAEAGARVVAKFDLTLELRDVGGSIRGGLEYSKALFDRATVERYLEYFRTLLAAMAADDRAVVDRVPLVTPDERRAISAWNATAAPVAEETCLHQLVEAQVARVPAATAVLDDTQTLTYGELNARANQLASYLRTLGVGPDSRVAICLERRVEMVVALLAVLKAGGAYVPLDPAYPEARLRFMLKDSAPVALLTDDRVELRIPDRPPGMFVVDVTAAQPLWRDAPSTNLDPAQLGLTPAHLAYIIYTSGSTGMPKGAMNEHRAICNRLSWMQSAYQLDGTDAVLQKTPFSFDVSVWEFFWPLLAGARLVMARPDGHKDPAYLCHVIAQHCITTAHFVPSMLQLFLDCADAATCASLTRLVCSGEALSGALARRFHERFSGTALHNLYGPTETAVDVTAWTSSPEAVMSAPPPIGRPIANTQIHILDGQGAPVPVGVTGELHIGGVAVGRGYLGRPALTAERFVPNPFTGEAGSRLYRTGDLGRWHTDGTIEYLGRTDFQFKLRGNRIELGEIEACLASQEGVQEAVVVAREEMPGDARLVAYYTGIDGAHALGVEALRRALMLRLPDYMVPGAYVRLDAWPLTPSGKLDRRALLAPDASALAACAYEPPLGEIETALAEIWVDVLAVDRVGRHDDFFGLGGHSLLAVRMIERLRRRGWSLEVRALFAASTLAGMAAAVKMSTAALVEVPPNGIPAHCDAISPSMLTLVNLSEHEIATIASRVSGGAANIQDIYPLAPLQEGILFHHRLGGQGDPYLLTSTLRFDNRARVDAYLAALQAVVDRHDILRTAVHWEGVSEPVQVVLRHVSVPVEEMALARTVEDPARDLFAQVNPRRFRIDVRQAPWLRVYLAHDNGNGWVMVQLFHHLAGDHTTLDAIQREIQAHLLGEAASLPAPVPFRALVAQSLLGVSESDHAAFFRQMLGDVVEPTAPFGTLDVQGDGVAVGQTSRRLDGALAGRIRRRSRALGVSAASLCHLAWAQVLACVSNRADVVFGTVLLGRLQGMAGADRAMGLFINTLPVRIRIDGEGVAAAVRRTHALLADLLRHEHASLALAQRCSGVPPPAPLFSALLNYRHGAAAVNQAGHRRGWEGIQIRAGEERTNYPVGLSVDDLGEGFRLTAQVAAPVDPADVCDLMEAALESLVSALETDAKTPVCALDVLPRDKRLRLLVDWNATETAIPRDTCVHELFEAQAASEPSAPAVTFGPETLSYGELNLRANQLAHYLRSVGVGPEARVAVCLERGPETIVSLLAVWKAGGVYVPLDPAYPVERLSFMIEDSAPAVMLTARHISARLPSRPARMSVLDVTETDAAWRSAQATNLDRNSVDLTADHLAYIIYTSGSTGAPKGVMVPHRGLCNLALAQIQRFGVDAESRILQFASLSFDASISEVVMTLCRGAHLVLAAAGEVLAGDALCGVIASHSISHVTLPPAVIGALPESADLESVRCLIVAGEAPGRSLVDRWVRGRRVINAYGPTEGSVCATTFECRADDPSAPPIGQPIANTQIYVLGTFGAPVPVGVVGELYIGGVGVARGYLGRPALTADRFVPDPFSHVPGARLYRTGDLGRWREDGVVEFLGRSDFQIKLRGYRIELGEIEACLAAQPGVREALAVAREDEGERRIVAYYTCADASDGVAVEELRSGLLLHLPEYMVPSAYVQLDSWPLTPSGKLNRAALPEPGTSAYAVHGYEAPCGVVEPVLAAIWADVLHIDRVGRHDDFFALGGHSLLAVRMIERLRQCGWALEVRALFATPTLAQVAAAITPDAERVVVPPNRIPMECDTITPSMLSLANLSCDEIETIVRDVTGGARNIQDVYPLAPLQQGILFHHLLEGEGDPYLSAVLMSFDSRAHLDRYIAALQSVIDRHDILRTEVKWEGLREPMQVVLRRVELPVEEVHLDPASVDVGRELYARVSPRRVRVDIRRAPWVRLCVAPDPAHHRWMAVQLLHHLAGDHNTLEVLEDEIRAHLAGDAETLPAPLPFRNLIAQARLGLSEADHTEFFRRHLSDVVEPTAPFGLMDVQGDGSAIQQARVRVDQRLAARLRRQARLLSVSAASISHLAWARVLAAVSGRRDVVFGTVVFGRMRAGAGADRAMGLFINTLPVRIRIDADGVASGVRRTHVLLADLLRHEHAPLSLAQRCSAVPAPTPLFSAALNYRHITPAAPRGRHSVWDGIHTLYGEERTNYPLGLSVDDLGEGFGLVAQVVPPIDPHRVCALMRTALESLVAALETAPETPVCALEVLPQAERRQVVTTWNETTAQSSAGASCVHELFEAQAARTPAAPAVVSDSETISYASLNARSNQLSHHLRALGVGPDARVAICLPRGVDLVVAVLAVWKAGGAYVPLDPAYPAERLRFMLEDSSPAVLVTDDKGEGRLPDRPPGLRVVDLTEAQAPWQSGPTHNLDRTRLGLDLENLAYLIYTSGSTGAPKGVMVAHRGLSNLVDVHARRLSTNDTSRILQFASFSFDGCVFELVMALGLGAALHLLPAGEIPAGQMLGEAIRRRGITHAILPPAVLVTLDEADLASVSTLVVSGDALSESLAARWSAGRRLIHGYGPTETTVCATLHDCRAGEAGAPPIGAPIVNTQIYILDDLGAPVPVGVAGELHIGGAGVARGYVKRPSLTAERFVPDPFGPTPGARLYRTGDIGRWRADGTIEFLGRADFQIKLRGYRIELGEIEEHLRAQEAIREAVVVSREDGAAGKRLIAYYTSRDAANAPNVEALRAALAQRLPEYMVPSAYVGIEAWPLTPSGKVDRQALPVPDAVAASRGYEAPLGEIENALAEIWTEVLRVDNVGRHDHFFALGGHSLLAVTVIERMRRRGWVIEVRTLFATPVLADVAAAVTRKPLAVSVPPNLIPAGCDEITPSMLTLFGATEATE